MLYLSITNLTNLPNLSNMDISEYIPKYDGKESITKYMRRVETFKLKLVEDKYNLLLDFINEFLGLIDNNRLKSLTDFKNMSETRLLKDPRNNRKVLRKYSDDIINRLQVKFNVEDDTDSDEIKDKYILYFLSKSLVSINYSLTYRKYKDEVYYTIKPKD